MLQKAELSRTLIQRTTTEAPRDHMYYIGQPFPGPFALLEEGWLAAQHRLAALSDRSTLTTADSSNHMIHLDQPELVIDLVRQMHGVVSQNSIDSAQLA